MNVPTTLFTDAVHEPAATPGRASGPASISATARLQITDVVANERFRRCARSMDLDPDDRWIGGYVDWEWEHSRHLFDVLADATGSFANRSILEFGCHVGATSIVLAKQGARVTGVDVNPSDLELARLNAERYGCANAIAFRHVPDTTTLPFATGQFDLITCNSVLEYVERQQLPTVLAELDRVLADRGLLVILGTSNRLWPQEVHSRRWLINYVPDVVNRLLGRRPPRSLFPWQLRGGFASYEDLGLADGEILSRSKLRMGVPQSSTKQLAARLLSTLRISLGMLGRSITLVLRKP